MEYKVLIKLYVPEIEESYEFYISINKYVGEIAESLNKIVNEISDILPIKANPNLCNRQTGNIYNKNYLLRQTDIRNGTELVLF